MVKPSNCRPVPSRPRGVLAVGGRRQNRYQAGYIACPLAFASWISNPARPQRLTASDSSFLLLLGEPTCPDEARALGVSDMRIHSWLAVARPGRRTLVR